MDTDSMREMAGLGTLGETEGARRATGDSANVRRDSQDPSNGDNRIPDPEVPEKPVSLPKSVNTPTPPGWSPHNGSQE